MSSILLPSCVFMCGLTHIQRDPCCSHHSSRITNYSEASKEQWCSSVSTVPQHGCSVRDPPDAWLLRIIKTNARLHDSMKKLVFLFVSCSSCCRLEDLCTAVAPDGSEITWLWRFLTQHNPVRKRRLLWNSNNPPEDVWRQRKNQWAQHWLHTNTPPLQYRSIYWRNAEQLVLPQIRGKCANSTITVTLTRVKLWC